MGTQLITLNTIRLSEEIQNDSIVCISSDDSVVYVCTEKKQGSTNYFGDKSNSATDSSWSFHTPPSYTEKLKALYAGVGSKYLNEDDIHMEDAVSSTPKHLEEQENPMKNGDEGDNSLDVI